MNMPLAKKQILAALSWNGCQSIVFERFFIDAETQNRRQFQQKNVKREVSGLAETGRVIGETAEGDQAVTLSRQLKGYRLTTADILYWRPDHPSLLQSFIWQELDLAPKFPMLSKFLDFWQSNLDGRLHEVRVASAELIKPAEFRFVDEQINLH